MDDYDIETDEKPLMPQPVVAPKQAANVSAPVKKSEPNLIEKPE